MEAEEEAAAAEAVEWAEVAVEEEAAEAEALAGVAVELEAAAGTRSDRSWKR